MPKNLPESPVFAPNIVVPTDGEAFNENVQDQFLSQINNRLLHTRDRVQVLEDVVVPELMWNVNGQVISTTAVGISKLGMSLPGRPFYSVPEQYWGPVDPATFDQNGTGWPNSNSQFPYTYTNSPTPGPIAVPNEWVLLNNRAENNEDITPEQARSPLHVYAPESGWYRVSMDAYVTYRPYQNSPVGVVAVDTSIAVLFKTFKNDVGTSYAGSYVTEWSGPPTFNGGLDTSEKGQISHQCMIYLDGNSTNLEDYFFAEFFVTPGYDELYQPETNRGRLPNIVAQFRMQRVVGPKLTP